jgi:hypothetical protein
VRCEERRGDWEKGRLKPPLGVTIAIGMGVKIRGRKKNV